MIGTLKEGADMDWSVGGAGVASRVTNVTIYKPMNANQVLNSIPRQKVKHKDGRIGNVLGVGVDGKYVAIMTVNPAHLVEWHIEDCEPVPEEPRGFRVNDKVAIVDGSGTSFSIVETVAVADCGLVYVWTYGDEKPVDMRKLRLATPQELKDYFLND